MVFHPPMLYLGFVSFVIPFAFAIAALITGRSDDRWIRITRRWTLAAWLFLSAGLILGMRWAYDVLGWGGYWGWDPVEVAALLPWLPGTAFLHSVVIQEKRDMLKHWNMALVILTYALVIFGTFFTRSGVLSSVHAFAESAIGPLFLGFIGFTFIISLALLLWRWNSLKTEVHMTSLFSREAMFLVNNLLFLAIFIVCFWGVVFPVHYRGDWFHRHEYPCPGEYLHRAEDHGRSSLVRTRRWAVVCRTAAAHGHLPAGSLGTLHLQNPRAGDLETAGGLARVPGAGIRGGCAPAVIAVGFLAGGVCRCGDRV